jgi:hypothetical protein
MILKSVPPGSFNDSDTLIVGEYHHGSILPPYQAQLHQLGFWALITSPLLIGGDVRKISPEYQELFLNGYILSINQDLAVIRQIVYLAVRHLQRAPQFRQRVLWQ